MEKTKMNKGYISKKKAIDELDYAYMHCADIDRYGLSTALDVIDEIESADVAPVVRCGQCGYWHGNDGDYGYCYAKDGQGFGHAWRKNDFCSYGERKE